MSVEKCSSNKAFGGTLSLYKFKSSSLGGLEAQFNVFVPSSATASSKAPILFYLAGLTCNENTAPWKSGMLRDAAAEGIALVFPDTSPRGAGVEGEDDNWDFGTGAGFYLNATSPKFAKHYNMYDYITEELPKTLESLDLPLDLTRTSIFGHSMGGHGALTLYLRSPSKYRSASAFSPAMNPSQSPWGQKAFNGYLEGGIKEGKEKYDATELIGSMKGVKGVHVLVDYGDADQFYKDGQLLPENFIKAARAAGFQEEEVNVRPQAGYDHSYYFISTFAPEHIKFHAKFLKCND